MDDLDDRSPAEVAISNRQGITVLSRRNIESYLYDDEVLTSLCASVGRSSYARTVAAVKRQAISDSVERGHPSDDIKAAAGFIYTETKRILELTQAGNDRHAFARNTLAPLIKPGMAVYEILKRDIFGARIGAAFAVTQIENLSSASLR